MAEALRSRGALLLDGARLADEGNSAVSETILYCRVGSRGNLGFIRSPTMKAQESPHSAREGSGPRG